MTYDFIGDIHGCFEELEALLHTLSYQKFEGIYHHPEGRIPVFIGDLTDRGPDSISVMKLVSQMVLKGKAKYVPGNHCDKLYRYLLGNNVKITHGLETTVAELEQLSKQDKREVSQSFRRLYKDSPLYLALADKQVYAAHAGLRRTYQGRTDKAVKTFVLYGDVTGEKHPDGSPVRRDWARLYDGEAWVVYGHTPVLQPRVKNRTINIDTGCVFGGSLTAFRYPEMDIHSIPSMQPYLPEKFSKFADSDPLPTTNESNPGGKKI
ncbi:bis(5'-nucleosyl)-tetraphosphatase PrpE [Salsuginibacillus kocurii]|uniref:bis(5'-nucleosyl)-tetraphosphatase PrpE n=1 Tax=Salsuginibacillus kocurii TaxID=427078 RepID=UPI0003677840|nr:bis(5'-nucleosyl)-tetraphosphatase PrpE [Salsuginibacillus kocurii]